MSELVAIGKRYEALRGVLDERSRLLLVAAESLALGRGAISAVSRATGVSRQVIARGRQELTEPAVCKCPVAFGVPAAGASEASRKTRLWSASWSGWSSRSRAAIRNRLCAGPAKACATWAAELERQGHPTSHRMVAELLHKLGCRLQANRKTKEGTNHPDRNAQFEKINRKVKRFWAHNQPAISVDTKKRELVGEFKNNGRELRPAGDPEKVQVHDFLIPELGRATPYGVYDLARNTGWVSVGVDRDTATFAVETIRRWWRSMGTGGLCRGRALADHRRRGRQQRRAGAAVEAGAAKAGGRNRAADCGVSLPAGHQQVE